MTFPAQVTPSIPVKLLAWIEQQAVRHHDARKMTAIMNDLFMFILLLYLLRKNTTCMLAIV
jgi:hypothetical protein